MKKINTAITEGPVARTLTELTIPMIFGMISIVIFNMVDTYYVGKLGTTQIAALAFTFPVVMVIGSLAQGIGVGVSAVVSKAVGEGEPHKIQRLATDGMVFGVILVALFAVTGLVTIRPLFTLLGADEETLAYVIEYMRIWYVGVVFVVIPMIGNNIIRALGDMKTPSLVMATAALVNMILDPILIFGFGFIEPMGVSGAAIATVLSRAITLIVALIVLIHRENLISFKGTSLGEMVNSWKEILFIGLPDAFAKMMIPFGAGIMTGIVATYGKEAVAAFGIGSRLDMFSLMVIHALASVLIPFVGQNLGAGKMNRVQEGIKSGERFVIAYGIVIATIFIFFGGFFVGIFSSNPIVVTLGQKYLWIVPLGYSANGIILIGGAVLMVLKNPIIAASLTIFRLFLINIPFAFLGSHYFGTTGVFFSIALSFIVMAVPAHIIMKNKLKENYQLRNLNSTEKEEV